MKKLYFNLDTGARVAESLPELDALPIRPSRVGAFLVPKHEDFLFLDSYTSKKRVAIW
jgi:hypothetical protein